MDKEQREQEELLELLPKVNVDMNAILGSQLQMIAILQAQVDALLKEKAEAWKKPTT